MIIDFDDAWMRKLCAGAQAVGLLQAMLRVGALPTCTTPEAQRVVAQWAAASAEIDARIAERQAADAVAKAGTCH